MKDKLLITALVMAGLLALAAIMFSMRWFSNATTPITVHEVEKGVKCATMVTADGAAISCWKTKI